MPRDKTATNARIIRCLKEEFLAYGYNKDFVGELLYPGWKMIFGIE